MKFWEKKSVKENKPSFQEEYTTEERVKRRRMLQQRYPKQSFSYLVIEGLDKFQNQKHGYTLIGVQNTMPLLYLIQYLRKSLTLDKNSSLTIMVKQQVKQMGVKIGELNQKYKNQDGFLYLKLKSMNYHKGRELICQYKYDQYQLTINLQL